MLLWLIVVVYCQNRIKCIHISCGPNAELCRYKGRHIQGDSGGEVNIVGGDSIDDIVRPKINSYERPNFEWLPRWSF